MARIGGRGFQQQPGHQVHARRERVEVVEGCRQPIAKVERIGHPHPVETERELQSSKGQRHAREDEYQAEKDVGHVRALMMDRFCDTKQHAVFAARDPQCRSTDYADIFTPAAIAALHAVASLDDDRQAVMRGRIARRAARAGSGERIRVSRSGLRDRPHRHPRRGRARRPLHRQRDPGRPAAPVDPGHRPGRQAAARRSSSSIRNVAYALLSGADGWMFDGEDALGQVSTMSLDNQRNLKLAIHRDPVFLQVAEQVAGEMNAVGAGLPRPADRRRLADAARRSPPRSSAPAGCTSTTGTSATPTAPASRRRSSTRRCTSSTTTSACASRRRRRWCCICRRSRPPRKRRCGTTS